jgi:hypothetical protein
LLVLISCQSFAQIKFRGKVIRVGADVYVVEEGSKKNFTLYSADPEIREHINLLSQGDFIEGVATSITPPRLFVESIDFVGLKKILGTWKTNKRVFDFKDFNLLSIWSFDFGNDFFSRKKNYTYSISPGEGPDWQVFVADENHVVVGSLDFVDNIAILTIYDSNTGSSREVITLEKINTH